MTDYNEHAFGGVEYPLSPELDATFLKDADPALYWLLDYIAWAVEYYAGARIVNEAIRCGRLPIKSAVATTTPWDPSRALVDKAFATYPVLALYRTSEKFTEHSRGWMRSDGTWELLYVLPPMSWQQWEKFSPVLRTVARVVMLAIEQGHDPGYRGDIAVYDETHAGIQSVSVSDAAYGSIEDSEGLITYALTMTLSVKERQSTHSQAFSAFTGTDGDVRVYDGQTDTTTSTIVSFATAEPPTITTVSPATGTKNGGTPITITGTLFIVGATPVVTIGGVACTSVVVASTTSVTAVTPAGAIGAHDLVLTRIDGGTVTSSDAFTYT